MLHRSGYSELGLVLRVDIRNLDQIIETNIHRFENDRYTDFLEEITVNSKIYGNVKRMIGFASRDNVSLLVDATGP